MTTTRGGVRFRLLAGFQLFDRALRTEILSGANRCGLLVYELGYRLVMELPSMEKIDGYHITRGFTVPTWLPWGFDFGVLAQEYSWGSEATVICSPSGEKLQPFWIRRSGETDPSDARPMRMSTAKFVLWGEPNELPVFCAISAEEKDIQVTKATTIASGVTRKAGIVCTDIFRGRASRYSAAQELSPAIDAAIAKAAFIKAGGSPDQIFWAKER